MTPSEIAFAAARALYEASQGHPPWDESMAPPTLHDHLLMRDGHKAVAAWLPWNWATNREDHMLPAYVLPLAKMIHEKIGPDEMLSGDRIAVPEGMPAAWAEFGQVGVRAVICEHPVPSLWRYPGAKVRNWYNVAFERQEVRDVLPLLRLDVRVKQKEMAH
jgi:hypothetical protein